MVYVIATHKKQFVFLWSVLLCSITHALGESNNKVECLFSHGIADTYKQAEKYVKSYCKNNKKHTNPYSTIPVITTSFNYPDATNYFWRVNFWHTSFGQKNEINALKKAIEKKKQAPLTHHTSTDLLLYGISRGASTILTFLSHYPNTNNICALVLESPYDHIKTVAQHIVNTAHLACIPYSYDIVHATIGMIFARYSKNGINPLSLIKNIPTSMPILIICSLKDQLVPWYSSYRIYQELRATGHSNAHILILKQGTHACFFCAQYRAVVHAFYKKYGLPYDALAASNGQLLFNFCQP